MKVYQTDLSTKIQKKNLNCIIISASECIFKSTEYTIPSTLRFYYVFMFQYFFFIDLQLKLQSLNSKKKSDEPLRCFDKLYCSIQVQVTQCPKVKFNKHSLHI